MPEAFQEMKSIEYPFIPRPKKGWVLHQLSQSVLEQCKRGLPEGFELRHVSIDARTGNVTVFYEERHAERQPPTRTP